METKVLGDYTLIRKIGDGGFGSVYLAEHRFIKKYFAIKILSSAFSADDEFICRFEKDVGVLAKLDHPSIIKVHNISQTDGLYFMVMDCISDELGEITHLGDYLDQKGNILSEHEVEMILRQVASALDYAHEITFGDDYLIHRGLKLTNILVDKKKEQLRIYLSDFGMVRLLGEKRILQNMYESIFSGESISPDREKPFLDQMHFLAPEQRSPNNKITIKSDVYAFGVLAYYLITQRYPEGYFPLPSKCAPEYKLNWDFLICNCLSLDPENRPHPLVDMMNSTLSPGGSNTSSLNVLSWDEVQKRVENAMQMSFEFKGDYETDQEPFLEEEKEELRPIIKPQEITRPQYDPDPAAIFHKELHVSYYQPKKVEVKEVEPIFTEMVIIPGGSFLRGSNNGARDEMPRHKISISSFAMDIHPVTNEQFTRFLQAMGGEKDNHNNDIIRLRDSRIKRIGGKLSIESGYARHPVVGVTWYGAVAYAKWVGKRIPTEAEWEIAAKGGNEGNLYPTGEGIDHSQANFFGADTTTVMSYPANGYGLYDMTGNVYEWCEDWYAYNYYETSSQEPENPAGPPQGVYRVLRGGCWKSLKEDLRCSHRHRNNPGTVNSTYGFRCATDVS